MLFYIFFGFLAFVAWLPAYPRRDAVGRLQKGEITWARCHTGTCGATSYVPRSLYTQAELTGLSAQAICAPAYGYAVATYWLTV